MVNKIIARYYFRCVHIIVALFFIDMSIDECKLFQCVRVCA